MTRFTRRALLGRGAIAAAGVLFGGSLVSCSSPSAQERLVELCAGLTTAVNDDDEVGFASWFTSSALAAVWFGNLRQASEVAFEATRIDGESASFAASWRVPHDARAAISDVRTTVTESTRGFVIDSVSGASRPVWSGEPLSVDTHAATTVMGGDGVDVDAWLDAADLAVADVTQHCPTGLRPGWDRTLVVATPTRVATFAAALGVSAADYESVAAVAWAEPPADAGPMRVYVNHAATSALAPIDRRVLLSHEATHVATRSTMPHAPHWLSEGLAERVGLAGSPGHLAHNTELARVYAAKHSSPDLPPDDDFEPGSTRDLATTYALAQQAVDALYARAGSGPATTFAVAVGAGQAWPISRETVTTWYRQRLAAL